MASIRPARWVSGARRSSTKLGPRPRTKAFCKVRRKEMYRLRSRFALALALAFIGSRAHAEQLEPGSPLSGYQCYSLNEVALKLTPEDAWDGKGFPPVFEGPSGERGKLGGGGGFFYVAGPFGWV